MKEILRNQPARFKNYAELTIMKTLEAHKDSHKEVSERFESFVVPPRTFASSLLFGLLQVVRAAEEAVSTLASSIQPEQCIKVLCPIVQTTDYPINLAAIKMQTRAIERITKEALLQLLPDVIPGLLQVRPRPLLQKDLIGSICGCGCFFVAAGLRQHGEQREEGQCLLPRGHLLCDRRGAQALPGPPDWQQGTSCQRGRSFIFFLLPDKVETHYPVKHSDNMLSTQTSSRFLTSLRCDSGKSQTFRLGQQN